MDVDDFLLADTLLHLNDANGEAEHGTGESRGRVHGDEEHVVVEVPGRPGGRG
jgi:hypothetical protein